MKLFDKTPADLPADLRQQLTGWLSSTPIQLEGYLRPGCMFLTVQLQLEPEAAEAAEARGMQHLLGVVTGQGAHKCWRDGMLLLQVCVLGRCWALNPADCRLWGSACGYQYSAWCIALLLSLRAHALGECLVSHP